MNHLLLGDDKRGQLSRAAEYLKCQRSYLSRVIKDKHHLSPDQAYLLTKFFKFNNDERDYFTTLVEFERAGEPEYKNFLKQKVSDLKKKYDSIQERTQRQVHVTDNLQLQYFSNWIPCALQFLTMIPSYQNSAALAERLCLKKEVVVQYLEQLEKMDLVSFKNNKWINKSDNFHIPKESPLVVLHHQNWRSRAVLDAQQTTADHVHFTGVYTLSFDDFQRIKDMLLTFISDANRIIGPSKCEEGIVLACDLFRV